MGKCSFRVVPRMVNQQTCQFDFVTSDGRVQTIAYVLFPADCQMNDNLDTAKEISESLRKRIRKSV